MDYDVRCRKLQARLVDAPRLGRVLEVQCDSRICRLNATNVVVLHYFSLVDGQLLETKRYRDPVARNGKEVKA